MNRGDLSNQHELRFPREWDELEISILEEMYARANEPGGVLRLNWLAERFGRDKANVCRKARILGFTNQSRNKVAARKVYPPKFANAADRAAATSARTKALFATRGHPRGALGMRHTAETRERIARKSAERWKNMTDEQRDAHVFKAVKAKRDKGIPFSTAGRGSWKAGWREVGEQRCYFRSRWEANYARYLEWLRTTGHIASWEHEAHTFWFYGIRRGCVSYLPDFRVTEIGGAVRWHEVKGWMDARSQTVLTRMAKYHPTEVLIVIREKQYKEIGRKVSALIPGWES